MQSISSSSKPVPESPRSGFPYVLAGATLLGFALCVANSLGAELFCASSGCSVYKGYRLFGLSFYLWGAAGFLGLLLLGLLSWRQPRYGSWLGVAYLIALLVDGGFLLWQGFFWPCTSCLAVALLLGIGFLGSFPLFSFFPRPVFALFFLFWFGLGTPAALSAVRELALPPWMLLGSEDAPVKVFFSPTCQACIDLLGKINLSGEDCSSIGFCPVAKNGTDAEIISSLSGAGIQSLEELLMRLQTAEKNRPDVFLQLALARNKMALARLGAASLPQVVGSDLFLQGEANGGFDPSLLLYESGVDTRCSVIEEDPCPSL